MRRRRSKQQQRALERGSLVFLLLRESRDSDANSHTLSLRKVATGAIYRIRADLSKALLMCENHSQPAQSPRVGTCSRKRERERGQTLPALYRLLNIRVRLGTTEAYELPREGKRERPFSHLSPLSLSFSLKEGGRLAFSDGNDGDERLSVNKLSKRERKGERILKRERERER